MQELKIEEVQMVSGGGLASWIGKLLVEAAVTEAAVAAITAAADAYAKNPYRRQPGEM